MSRSALLLLAIAAMASCHDDGVAGGGRPPRLVSDNFAAGALLPYGTTEFHLELTFSEAMLGLPSAVWLDGGAALGETTTRDGGLAWTAVIGGLSPGSEVTVVIEGATDAEGDVLDPPVRGTLRVDRAPVAPADLNAPSGCEGTDVELRWTAAADYGTYDVEVDLGDGWVTTGISGVETDRATLRWSTAGTFPWRVVHRTETGSAEAGSLVTIGLPAAPVAIDWPATVFDSFAAASFAVEPDPAGPAYEWSPPPGARVVAGEGTASVTVDFTGAATGTMSVVAANGCGPSAALARAVEVRHDYVVTFADATLEACVREAVGVAAPAPLLASVLAGVTFFGCVGEIGDLSGLEALVGLTHLTLNVSEALADLSPLAGLRGLERLVVGGATLSDLTPLAGLTRLLELRLSACSLRDVSVLAGLTSLTTLDLSQNELSDLSPLAGLTSLTELDVASNDVTDLSPLAGLAALELLEVHTNPLTDLGPIAGLTALQDLLAENCDISDLSPLSGLLELVSLRLNSNQIVDLTPLAPLTALTLLNLGDNQIVDLGPLDGLTALNELRVSHNAVVDVSPLAGLTALTWLSLDDNAVEDPSPLGGLSSLFIVELQDNVLSDLDGLEGLDGLEVLRGSNNAIADVSGLTGLPRLRNLDLRNNAVVDVSPLATVPALETLILDLNQVTDPTSLGVLGAITNLQLSRNQVEDLSGFAATFDCSAGPRLSFTENALDAADCADVDALQAAGCDVSVDFALGC